MPLPHTSSLVYPFAPDSLPPRPLDQPPYLVTFANSPEDLDAVLRLRFDVFNLELREGFAESYQTGRDEDAFDRVMHHLMVIKIARARSGGHVSPADGGDGGGESGLLHRDGIRSLGAALGADVAGDRDRPRLHLASAPQPARALHAVEGPGRLHDAQPAAVSVRLLLADQSGPRGRMARVHGIWRTRIICIAEYSFPRASRLRMRAARGLLCRKPMWRMRSRRFRSCSGRICATARRCAGRQ